MKVAALDLGTNSFLCLLAEGQIDDQGRLSAFDVFKDLTETVRLGQDVNQTGKFHTDALLRADQCLENFSKEIKAFNPDKIFAVATSAARDASNGQVLFDIGKKYQIPISIIDGPTEAKITFLGATFKSKEPGNTLVIDVGGGSTELILGSSEGQILYATSVNVGAVRLTERFIEDQPVPVENQRQLNRFAETLLQPHFDKLLKDPVSRVVAVAGTPTAIAALEVGGFSVEKVENFNLSLQKMKAWQEEFATTSIRIKKEKYNLGGRADIIYAGTSILKTCLELTKKNEMFVSTMGVRYGVAIQLMRGQLG